MPLRFPTAALLVAAAAVLVACGGAPAVLPPVDVRADPYAAFPAPPDPAPEARPITARITERRAFDPDLARFLDRLTTAVERRAWDAVALFLDEEPLAEQLRFLTDGGLAPRRAAADALSAALGLDYADAPLLPEGADRDAAPFAGLDRLRTMTVQRVEADPDAVGSYRVSGYVRLDDRSTHEHTFLVVAGPRGWRVAVPMG